MKLQNALFIKQQTVSLITLNIIIWWKITSQSSRQIMSEMEYAFCSSMNPKQHFQFAYRFPLYANLLLKLLSSA